MPRGREVFTAPFALALAALVGGCCPPAEFRIETVLRADGSCDRTVWQPRHRYLPAEAFQPEWLKRWDRVTGVTNPPGDQPPKPGPGRCDYFVAHGTFRSPADIPDHYRFVDEQCPEAGASELKRRDSVYDAGFVTEHRWRETLTNIVTLPDFLKARDELLDIITRRLIEALEKELGREYDIAPLAAYIRGDGRRLANELLAALFDVAARHRSRDETLEMAANALKGFGLDLLDRDERPVSEQVAEQRVREFGRALFMKHVRLRDGALLTVAEADAIVKRLAEDSGSDRPSSRGGKAAAATERDDKRLERIALRLMGLYGPFAFLFEKAPYYEFALRLPGQLIETNGTIEGADRVRWRFSTDRLYPEGYAMEARSVIIDRDAQRKALGRAPIDSPAAAAELLDLVGGEGRLVEAVRTLRATGDASALRNFASASDDEGRRARRLRALLLKE